MGKNVTTSGDYWYDAYASSIYLPQSYCDEYGFSPPIPAAIGGGWFPLIRSQFLRSPSTDYNYVFGSISGSTGMLSTGYHTGSALSKNSFCPCFSI